MNNITDESEDLTDQHRLATDNLLDLSNQSASTGAYSTSKRQGNRDMHSKYGASSTSPLIIDTQIPTGDQDDAELSVSMEDDTQAEPITEESVVNIYLLSISYYL